MALILSDDSVISKPKSSNAVTTAHMYSWTHMQHMGPRTAKGVT
jgi:hypothetical protein